MYSISADAFWHKPLISYKCPVAGINMFFAGERKRVEKALDEYCDVYSDIANDIEEVIKDSSFNVVYELIDCLNTLQKKGLISCDCGSRDVEIDFNSKDIVLRCTHCRNTKVIETSEDSLIRVLNSNAIIIGK